MKKGEKEIMAARANLNLLYLAMVVMLCIALASCGNAAADKNSAQKSAQKNGGGTAAVSLPEDESPAQTDLAQTGSAQDGSSQAEPTQTDPIQDDAGDIIQIGEKMFVGQINDIYANPDEYLGKTIRYEGFYMFYDNEEMDTHYDCVLRNGPGCCGNDSQVGFEIIWGGALPNADDWVEVTGEMSSYEEDGWSYLYVNAAELRVLPYRGNDTVS
ncbi:MAG: hypothetical protein LBS85_03085 [Clostridiales Family XIII bacterium]|jgi:uncharacterized membrane protein YcgQ (UPF0703/DUF1980 family)|nr:hypothetical protein [Clostridiales Family XIII bacterium]